MEWNLFIAEIGLKGNLCLFHDWCMSPPVRLPPIPVKETCIQGDIQRHQMHTCEMTAINQLKHLW